LAPLASCNILTDTLLQQNWSNCQSQLSVIRLQSSVDNCQIYLNIMEPQLPMKLSQYHHIPKSPIQVTAYACLVASETASVMFVLG
jgi:hypothetical protein